MSTASEKKLPTKRTITPVDFMPAVELITLKGNLLEDEEAIRQWMMGIGRQALAAAFALHDTDGRPIEVEGARMTSKGRQPKEYQTTAGPVTVARHVYQGSRGGTTHCPMEASAGIIVTSTAGWARQASGLMSRLPVREAMATLEDFGRAASALHLQSLAAIVGAGALAAEQQWDYAMPELPAPVATVGVSLDGANIKMDGQWRQAMAGALSFYDDDGERLHTIYLAAAPEANKVEFLERLEAEVGLARERHPEALFLGLADGAPDNWTFLDAVTDRQTLDFWHAAQNLGAGARAACPDSPVGQKEWRHKWRHILLEKAGGARKLIRELVRLETKLESGGARADLRKELAEALTYYRNQACRMNYAENRALGLRIGSGVVEAACKAVIKQRMCVTGARWKFDGARAILALRALERTDARWPQFWRNVQAQGLPCPSETSL